MRDFLCNGWEYWTETPERGWVFFRIQATTAIVSIAIAAVLIATGHA